MAKMKFNSIPLKIAYNKIKIPTHSNNFELQKQAHKLGKRVYHYLKICITIRIGFPIFVGDLLVTYASPFALGDSPSFVTMPLAHVADFNLLFTPFSRAK